MSDPVINWLCQQLEKKVSEKHPDKKIFEIKLSKIRGNKENPFTLEIGDFDYNQDR